jgi:hypothetical protein
VRTIIGIIIAAFLGMVAVPAFAEPPASQPSGQKVTKRHKVKKAHKRHARVKSAKKRHQARKATKKHRAHKRAKAAHKAKATGSAAE